MVAAADQRQILDIAEPQQPRFSSRHGFKGQVVDAVILLDPPSGITR